MKASYKNTVISVEFEGDEMMDQCILSTKKDGSYVLLVPEFEVIMGDKKIKIGISAFKDAHQGITVDTGKDKPTYLPVID